MQGRQYFVAAAKAFCIFPIVVLRQSVRSLHAKKEPGYRVSTMQSQTARPLPPKSELGLTDLSTFLELNGKPMVEKQPHIQEQLRSN